MKQMTLAVSGFESHGKQTRKTKFLARIDKLAPWMEFCSVIDPYYPKAVNGRPHIGLERMLRMYCIANCFNPADEACEDAMYDIRPSRAFCRIDLGRERVLDATSLLGFRYLLEENHLGAALLSKASVSKMKEKAPV